MLISDKLNAKLNEQIANEFFASQTYLAMGCYFKREGLHLLAKRFREQATEEREHAEKIIDYIIDRQGAVEIGAVAAAASAYGSAVEALQAAYDHEIKVSNQIYALCEQAEKDHDRTSVTFLDWFVEEQVEEVRSMHELVQTAKQAGPMLLTIEAYLVHKKN